MAQVLIRTTEETKEALRAEAKRLGITMNALLVTILRDWLDSRGN